MTTLLLCFVFCVLCFVFLFLFLFFCFSVILFFCVFFFNRFSLGLVLQAVLSFFFCSIHFVDPNDHFNFNAGSGPASDQRSL